jgi:excisionase family DNA binding protein
VISVAFAGAKMKSNILLSKKSVAGLLSICVRTLEKLIAAGELPVIRIGSRVMIPRNAVENFARRDHSTQSAKNQNERSIGRTGRVARREHGR